MSYERNPGREGMHTATSPSAYTNVSISDPHTINPRTLRHRASTAPVGQSPSTSAHHTQTLSYYPPFLAPGYSNGPQTVHKADIFFGQPNPNKTQQYSGPNVQQTSRSATQQLEGSSSFTAPHETRPHRSVTLPTSPPIPPKPTGLATRIPPYPQLPRSVSVSPSPAAALATLQEQNDPQNIDTSTPPTESDLAVALALSESETNRQQELLRKLAEQEEEELARALAASLADCGPADGTDELERALAESLQFAKSSPNPSGGPCASSSRLSPVPTFYNGNGYVGHATLSPNSPVSTACSSQSGITHAEVFDSRGNLSALQGDIDESQQEIDGSSLPYLVARSPQPPPLSLKPTDTAADTVEGRQQSKDASKGLEVSTSSSCSVSSNSQAFMNEPSEEKHICVPQSCSTALRHDLPAYAKVIDPPLPRGLSSVSVSPSISYPQLSSPSHSSALSDSAASSPASLSIPSTKTAEEFRNDDSVSLNSNSSSSDSASSGVQRPSGPSRALSAASTMTAMNLNQFVDSELLFGVSIGFNPPTISATQVPMPGALPNIISLPYGKAPPLHIQAPSWRQLLKLMARMSGSRMEPAIEAMAVTKSDMKLRTVVQFFKPHQTSSEWRTILWFTIDHPIPSDIPSAYRYQGHNVNILPWSYTLSKIPDLLQDAADTPLSKAFVIPATDAVPYPMLPITLPNLATYLQAALDDSRKYMNDSSSGLRKLAKMVQMCYPTNSNDQFHEPSERSGMSGLLKKVMGRNNKANKAGRGGNEDTYELVTPFVPDEWG